MVQKYRDFGEFTHAAKQLFLKNPKGTHYTLAYSPENHNCRLMVSDKEVVVAYHSRLLTDSKRIAQLTQQFSKWMTLATDELAKPLEWEDVEEMEAEPASKKAKNKKGATQSAPPRKNKGKKR